MQTPKTTKQTESIPAKSLLHNSNFLLGICLAVCALVFIFYLIPNHIGKSVNIQHPMMSPRWLPGVLGWSTFILAVMICLVELLTKTPEATNAAPIERSPTIFVLAGVLLGYMLFFELAGAGLTAIVGTCVLFAARGVRSPYLYLLGGVIMPLALYYLFLKVINVPLPSGIL